MFRTGQPRSSRAYVPQDAELGRNLRVQFPEPIIDGLAQPGRRVVFFIRTDHLLAMVRVNQNLVIPPVRVVRAAVKSFDGVINPAKFRMSKGRSRTPPMRPLVVS